MQLPSSLRLVEVGPGDGLAAEKTLLPTQVKVELIEKLALAGVPEVIATSFLGPTGPAQFADGDKVLTRLSRPAGVLYTARVVDGETARQAVAAGVGALVVLVPATDGYGRRVLGWGRADAFAAAAQVLGTAAAAGVGATAVIAVAGGCPVEGPVAPAEVARLARQLAELGARRVTLADTAGLADPRRVEELFQVTAGALAGSGAAPAFRPSDERGLGLANTLAALQAGVTTLEGCLGGACGEGFGATATEDLAYLAGELGVSTGIKFPDLRRAARRLVEALGRPLPSRTLNVETREMVYGRVRPSA